jgi:hypothetical protein
VPAFARIASSIALIVLLAGCRMALTNRIDVNDDGSALVHVVVALDDQLYALANANGKDPLAQTASTPGWETTRRIAANGDHVIEWTKRASTLDDVKPVLESFYAAAKKSYPAAKRSPAQTNGVSGMSPGSWTIRADERPGLFTRRIHLQIDVPGLTPTSKNQALAASMMTSFLSVNTELKLPGKIVSSNGEQLADGTIRFTPSLTSPSKIDAVADVTDYGHIALAIVAAFGIIVIVALGVLRRSRVRAAP